ncbi:MAG: tRNA (adenosine(37)-N6)-threonylcarbamoyltransferase complex ATPase subunit type 1 TsaE [Bifidobacteriaceae bacterium]|nr:tRNA (adenosine(37)-N6)-threonylcarbamoyltransferase complex ATPase subunit type 1 TsaE [Bifidobacteriaceae bacterium]
MEINKKITNLSQLDVFVKSFVKYLHIGDVVILSGPLGVGKTAFTKSLAKAFGIKKPIVSPTFTLQRVYKFPNDKKDFNLPIKLNRNIFVSGKNSPVFLVHIDAYRLFNSSSPHSENGYLLYDQLQNLDFDSYLDNSLIVIEWGELVKNILDEAKLAENIIQINISFGSDDLSDSSRVFKISGLSLSNKSSKLEK